MPVDEMEWFKQELMDIKATLNKILDREESRASRLNESEKALALMESACINCRKEQERNFDAVWIKIREIKNAPEALLKTAGVVLGLIISICVLSGIVITVITSLQKAGVIR